MRAQGLTTHVGVTTGLAFCGLVGAPYRAEYSVLGPSVNLAARLMAAAAGQGVKLLCDAALHTRVLHEQTCLGSPKSPGRRVQAGQAGQAGHDDALLRFHEAPRVKIKGYDEPVQIYHVERDEARAAARRPPAPPPTRAPSTGNGTGGSFNGSIQCNPPESPESVAGGPTAPPPTRISSSGGSLLGAVQPPGRTVSFCDDSLQGSVQWDPPRLPDALDARAVEAAAQWATAAGKAAMEPARESTPKGLASL